MSKRTSNVKSVETANNPRTNTNVQVLQYDSPEECPNCNASILPEELAAFYFGEKVGQLFLCPRCKTFFVSNSAINSHGMLYSAKYAPIGDVSYKFSKELNDFSPDFCSIYLQSLQAEKMELNQVCGAGYRKALEFLVKDYTKLINPSEVDQIEKDLLGKVIEKHIKHPSIKNLALKSAWLGNDEVHYLKKHTERDINDLKKFILAITHFIEMELAVLDAQSIDRK